LATPTDHHSDADLTHAIREILSVLSPDSRLTTLSDSADLFDAGVIDSFGVLQLITELEAKLGVSIPAEELIPQNLWSVAAIRGVVKRISTSTP
jgi:acyl carrier protein